LQGGLERRRRLLVASGVLLGAGLVAAPDYGALGEIMAVGGLALYLGRRFFH
jgi:hypothetical protein